MRNPSPRTRVRLIYNVLHLIVIKMTGFDSPKSFFFLHRDLHRLVLISCSSLLSHCLLPSNGTDENICGKLPTLNREHIVELCKIMLTESLSFLQINLSQHVSPISPLHWNDIGGYESLKCLLRNVIEKRLVHAVQPNSADAQADSALGLHVPRGVLLHGPPG